MPPKFLIIAAIFFAVAVVGIWGVFLRPVPIETATGSITKKTFKPAGTYWQYPAGMNRGLQTPTAIPIAEAYVFELKVDGFEGPVFYSLNTLASQAFDAGQRVKISYKERVIPFVSKRLYVLDMNRE